jgi:hypothetical protein
MQAQSMLDVGAKYGPQFEDQAIEALKRSDPTRFATNAKLGENIQSQLDHINDIDPQALKDAEADIRGRQYAMGNTRGNAPTANEILAKYDVRNRMKQQTLGNVSQYLAGTPISSQFASISGAQQGAAPYNPVNFQPGVGLNPNAGALGTNFAMQSYGQQSANNNAANQYQLSAWQTKSTTPNPWLSAAGTVAGAAATAF